MNNFFPANYKVPKPPSDYMKLEDGANKFRFLSEPLLGYMYWTKDKKPVRQSEPFEGIPEDAQLNDEGKFRPKHFWAVVVWNFNESRVQILELTQATIQEPIRDISENEDWGDPRDYNITVVKKGQKLDTEYTVTPSPKTAVPAEAEKQLKSRPINLEALMVGADPFDAATGKIERSTPIESDPSKDIDDAFDRAFEAREAKKNTDEPPF